MNITGTLRAREQQYTCRFPKFLSFITCFKLFVFLQSQKSDFSVFGGKTTPFYAFEAKDHVHIVHYRNC